jgi:ACS family glucarate transporter-like MFS transporter
LSSRRSPWPIVGLLSLTATAGYLCRVNLSTAGALLMEEFELTQVGMGRAALCWAAITAAHAALPAGFGSALAALLTLRFLLGVTEAPTYPGAAQGLARWVLSGDRGRANGLVMASIGIGSALAPPLVSQVMIRWGWRAALLVSALPALLVALVWRRVAEPPSPVERNSSAAMGPPGRLRTTDFALLTASYTLQGYVGYIFVFWFYLYLVQERKFDLLQGAWASTLPWILSMISVPLGGFASDRLVESRLGPLWGRRAIPMLGMGLSGILIAVGSHTERPLTAVLALALATALVLSVEGPFWATMIGIAGPKPGAADGIMNMGSNLGGLISPTLTPVLAQHIGWENALYVAAVVSIVAASLWLGIRPREEPFPNGG